MRLKFSLKLPLVMSSALIVGLGVTVYATCAPWLGPCGELTAKRLGAVGLVWAMNLAGAWLLARQTASRLSQIAGSLDRLRSQPDAPLPVMHTGDELEGLCRSLREVLEHERARAETLQHSNEQMQVRLHVAALEKGQTEAVLHSLTDPVIVTDPLDAVVVANQAAQLLFGFAFDQRRRPKLREVAQHPGLVDLMADAGRRQVRGAQVREELVFGANGGERFLRARVSSVVDHNGEIMGAVGVLHDVTADKQAEKTKTSFVSAVSHELNAPLASIKAYVEMLADGEVKETEQQQEFYRIIEMQTDRMTRLIQNLLNLSRIEAGVVRISKEPVSLSEVVEAVVEVMTPVAEEKGQHLAVELSSVYIGVYADRDMLCQAVTNLVSNAIKYTPEGGRVNVKTQMVEDEALCEVADTGLGIGPDDIEKVFEKFYRIKANSQAASGTGLGLPLVKRIIEEVHDGKIEVRSQVGEGSTFRFTLPLSVPSTSSVAL